MSPEVHHPIVLLGWTLVHSVWQIALLGALFGGALLVSRRPNTRYACAAIALFACAIAPFATYGWLASNFAPPIAQPKPSSPLHVLASAPPAASDFPVQPSREVVTPSPPTPANPWPDLESRMPLLVSLWLTGFSGMSLRIAGGLLVIALRRRGAWKGAPEWQERLDRLAQRCGVLKPVSLQFSGSLDSPVVVGILKATILFPASALTSLSVDQIEALLVHELAHIKRHDFLVNLIQSVVLAALFFHPVVWWISSVLRKERELCCDDIAVNLVGDPVAYAGALASLESFRIAMPQLALHANGGHLMHRIQRIVSTPQPASAAGFAWLPCLAAVAITGVTAGTVTALKPDLVIKPIALVRNAVATVRHAVGLPGFSDPLDIKQPQPELRVTQPTPLDASLPNNPKALPDGPQLIAPNFVSPYVSFVKLMLPNPAAPNGALANADSLKLMAPSEPPAVSDDPEVSGRVLSNNDVPVPNADVILTVEPYNPHEVFVGKADNQGWFKFAPHLKQDQKPRNLYAFRKGQGMGRIGVDGTLNDLVVKLIPSTKVRVRFQDREGHPLAGIKTKPELLRGSAPTGVGVMFDLPTLISNEVETSSGPDGIAILNDLPQGYSLRLGVENDGFTNDARFQDIDLPSSPSVDASMTLQPAAIIEGRLLRDGKGVPGQQVQAYGGRDESAQAWTDATGKFRLPKLSPGSYVLFAQLRPELGAVCVAKGLKIQLAQGEMKSEVNLELLPGVEVTGTLTGTDGNPMKDVDVRIAGPDARNLLWEQGTKTAADGTYHLRVPPGPQTARFWSKEHWLHGDPSIETTFVVEEDQLKKNLDWQIPPVARNVTIHGMVLGPDGKPTANATVAATIRGPRQFRPLTSGPNGSFTMEFDEALAPTVQFRAFKDDLAMEHTVTSLGGQVILQLKEHVWAVVEGDLVDPGGKPVANATVTLTGENEDVVTTTSRKGVRRTSRIIRPSTSLGSALTDSNGHFMLSRVLPWARVRISARLDGTSLGSEIRAIAVSAGSHLKLGHLRTEPSNSFLGTLIGDGHPVAGAAVTIVDRPGYSTTTDSQGNFRFGGLLPGRIKLLFTLPGKRFLTADVNVAEKMYIEYDSGPILHRKV